MVLAWALPALAALVVLGVLYAQVRAERGVLIEIRFDDAAGLEEGARLVYRGLRVGEVREIELAEDLSGVIVRAELTPASSTLAREGSAFWIVQPEVSLQRVSGLETILGPRYIGVQPGPDGAPRARTFEGLARAPALTPSADGALVVELLARRAGALAPGSPLLYRDIRVGSVRSFELAPMGDGVLVRVEIEPPYTALVREKTRFWYAGGVGVDWGLFSGLRVQAESIDALIEGAIAFATPKRPGEPVEQGARFELESSPPDGWENWKPEIPITGK